MASAKEIKRKITSIKNTGKITKAMELISTVKMKKAQDAAMTKKEFVMELLKIFLRIEDSLSEYPLFSWSKWEKALWIIITSNKGLCWGYNINVLKKVNNYIKEKGDDFDFITLGKKAARFAAKTGWNLIADYSSTYTDNIEPLLMKTISRNMMEEYTSWKYSKVVIFYTHFINTIKQVAVAREFLPISPKDIETYLKEVAGEDFDIEKELATPWFNTAYEIEPSREEIVNVVIPMTIDMMFYDMILESKASEHSSRMVAMKSAKDNAKKIAGALTLKYNKARQAMITKEVSEITAWVESLKDI